MENTPNAVAITGNTYPVREHLKALGARWNSDERAWMITPELAEKARCIVDAYASPTSQPNTTTTTTGFRHHKCVVCGISASRYQRIYRSGECRDCFEERKMGY